MKTLLISLTLGGCISLLSCKDDFFSPDDRQSDDIHSRIELDMPKPDGTGKNTVSETDESLTVASNRPITLRVDNPFETVSHVEWMVNGEKIGEGNNLETILTEIGVHKLTVNYRIGKGRYHREVDVYTYVTKRLSFHITPEQNLCGRVAIGITQHLPNGGKIGPGYSKATVQEICTADGRKTATAANIEVNFFSQTPKLEVELIEPREVKDDSRTRFCVLIFFCIGGSPGSQIAAAQLYETYTYEGEALNQLKAGTYRSGACEITIH